jgi:hypothetical protein
VLAITFIPVVDDWIAELRRLSALEKTTVGLYNKALTDLRKPPRPQGEFAQVLEDQVVDLILDRAKPRERTLSFNEYMEARS